MIKKLISVTFLIVNILLDGATYGQTQVQVPEYLKSKFLNYCESVPWEEIFVHSDRNEYIAGEDLWFNLFLIDRQSFKPSSNSRIAYFEILNPENRPVVQKRLILKNGFAPGQVVLPDTLSSGTYTIRAYTSWMKNFFPFNCYIRDINVYNAFSNGLFRGKKSSSGFMSGEINHGIDKEISGGGLNLKINNLNKDTLDLLVNAGGNYTSANNSTFFIFIQTHGIIDAVSAVRINSGFSRIKIPRKSLTPGVNQIAFFDSRGNYLFDRLVYTPYDRMPAMIMSSQDSYNTREKVTLGIEIPEQLSSATGTSDLSISVAPATDSHQGAIDDYMIFGTEFGLQPQGENFSTEPGGMTPEEIDSFLPEMKSNWINWERILSDKSPHYRYPLENEDHYLLGRLSERASGSAGPGKFILLSTPSRNAMFQYALTDKDGNFSFSIPIDNSLKDLIIQPDETSGNPLITIESSFSDQYLRAGMQGDTTTRPVPRYIPKWGINYQVHKIYETSSHGELLNPFIPASSLLRFYGKPDIELIMDDYIKLPVMQEVFFELIPGVLIKNRRSVYSIAVTDPVEKRVYDSPPGMLLDGVIIKDAATIATIDPELVEKIDVIKDKYFVGEYSFYGLVNVITRSNDFGSASLPPFAVRLHYRVADPAVFFVSPDYSSGLTGKNHIPDFRNTLYWNPSVRTGPDGKASIDFWTSDFVSDYVITVQGITSTGEMFSCRKIIKVR
jgi:hypothetical protein